MQQADDAGATPGMVDDAISLRTRYAHVLADLSDGVVLQDAEGRFVDVNATAGAWNVTSAAWTTPDGAGAGWDHPGHPAMRALRTRQAQERARVTLTATERRAEVRLLVTAVPMLRDDGVPYGVLSVLHDTTEQTAREDTLRRSEEHFRLAIEHAPNGFALLDLTGEVQRSNRALEAFLGLPNEAVLGRQLQDFIHAEDMPGIDEQVEELFCGDRVVVEAEVRWVRSDGTVLWGLVSAALSGAEGEPQHLVVQVQDTTRQRTTQDLLTHLALHDPLTGQPNRILVLDRIQKALERSRRTGHHVALLVCDIDRFKSVNDSLGHEAGDAVLIEVGNRVSAALRGGDTAGRLGGDEFVVVCEDVVDERDAIAVAERLLGEIREPIRIGGRSVTPTVSIGIALGGAPEADPISLLRDASTAMQRAKGTGRNTWEISDPEMSRRASDRLDLEHALRDSVVKGELSLHYQPIVDLATARPVGHEALLRWRHPERGLLPPAEFLHVAEDAGLIVDIGRWVIQQATTVASVAGVGAGYVAVNVSALQLGRPGLLNTVEEALQDSGLPADRLVLELTESVMLSAAPAAHKELARLDDLGIRVVVDDFGTGFSALSYLRDLPIRGIKIDRSFTSGLGRSHHCERIVEAVTGLGRGLGVDVVVEGVETEAQRQVLTGIGAAHAQGFLFGRPIPRLTAA
jgi:diguanylate cyclase (GGDEF)-like protein/PAS domain S-box-containing protein